MVINCLSVSYPACSGISRVLRATLAPGPAAIVFVRREAEIFKKHGWKIRNEGGGYILKNVDEIPVRYDRVSRHQILHLCICEPLAKIPSSLRSENKIKSSVDLTEYSTGRNCSLSTWATGEGHHNVRFLIKIFTSKTVDSSNIGLLLTRRRQKQMLLIEWML